MKVGMLAVGCVTAKPSGAVSSRLTTGDSPGPPSPAGRPSSVPVPPSVVSPAAALVSASGASRSVDTEPPSAAASSQPIC